MSVTTELSLNFFDPAAKRNPYPLYDELRAAGRVVRNPLMLGAAMVHRHRDVIDVLRDHDTFSSSPLAGVQDRADAFQAPTMLTSDPPTHTRLRGVVSRAFTPRAVAGLEPRLREVARDLVAPLRDGAAIDAVDDLAAPLPVIAIAELLGVPASDREQFRQWSDDLVAASLDTSTEADIARSGNAARHLREYFAAELATRRVSKGESNDLVGRLLAANEGAVLDDAELLAACVLLLVAGNETTTNLIANLTLALAQHPHERARVASGAVAAASAVEEAVRFDSPVQATIRTVTTPTSIAETDLDAGTPVFVLLAAANRDPDEYSEPDRFDVGRGTTTQVGFGHGIHFCLGAGLARLEARVACEELLAAGATYDVDADVGALEYAPSFIFHRPVSLPLRPQRASGTTPA